MRREQYYFKVQTYKKRREVARKSYSKSLQVMRNLTSKISRWQKAINRIDERNEKIKSLVRKVNSYFNVTIQSIAMDLEHKLARSIYFKIGMENKIQGKFLAEFIKRNKRTAFRNRVSLTQSFKTKPENRKAFYDFKNYIS